MIIAWPLIGIIGMFFASWMKPALPNGEWLQAHRALLVTSLFIAIVGFFTAFIANTKMNQSTQLCIQKYKHQGYSSDSVKKILY